MLGIGDHIYTAEMINKDAGNDSRIREMSLEEEEEGLFQTLLIPLQPFRGWERAVITSCKG